jgi:hypothetical protein
MVLHDVKRQMTEYACKFHTGQRQQVHHPDYWNRTIILDSKIQTSIPNDWLSHKLQTEWGGKGAESSRKGLVGVGESTGTTEGIVVRMRLSTSSMNMTQHIPDISVLRFLQWCGWGFCLWRYDLHHGNWIWLLPSDTLSYPRRTWYSSCIYFIVCFIVTGSAVFCLWYDQRLWLWCGSEIM